MPLQAKKAAPSKSSVNKASKQTRQAGKATKGWLGGAGGAKDLDKFYGACLHTLQPNAWRQAG